MSAALAMVQEVAIKTPDTAGYMEFGYLAIGAILAAYLLFLWMRVRKSRHS